MHCYFICIHVFLVHAHILHRKSANNFIIINSSTKNELFKGPLTWPRTIEVPNSRALALAREGCATLSNNPYSYRTSNLHATHDTLVQVVPELTRPFSFELKGRKIANSGTPYMLIHFYSLLKLSISRYNRVTSSLHTGYEVIKMELAVSGKNGR